eukprot:gnl/Dysnectes_brevis/1788_a2049_2669.p1 GENE.gnl/Dysnectes_brevis/1788_a2049_2669~~gnl/Dysnectes_brevis/1788_a2049_2669.p1  ORF type:complete len:327 (-),score=91.58 gnl/Dysnectes_brevis/1788_a2049_2669:42-1022(-)
MSIPAPTTQTIPAPGAQAIPAPIQSSVPSAPPASATNSSHHDEFAMGHLPKPTSAKGGFETDADRAINMLSTIFPGTRYSRLDTVYQQGRLRCVTLSCKGKGCRFAIWLRAQLQTGNSWKHESPQVWWFFARRKSMRSLPKGSNWDHSPDCREAQKFVREYQQQIADMEAAVSQHLETGTRREIMLKQTMEQFKIPTNQSQIVEQIIDRMRRVRKAKKAVRMPTPVVPVISKHRPVRVSEGVPESISKLYHEMGGCLHRRDVQNMLVLMGKGLGIVTGSEELPTGGLSLHFAPGTVGGVSIPPPEQEDKPATVAVTPPNPPTSSLE